VLRETRIESGVRKWLTYIALLLAAIAVVSDLVCFVDYFLKGELTVRFVLKCLTVLAICGTIFHYYFRFLQGRGSSGVDGAFALAGGTLAVCLGIGVAGTPRIQRQIESDGRRVQDLSQIAYALSAAGAPLPSSLTELATKRPDLRVRDVETGQLY